MWVKPSIISIFLLMIALVAYAGGNTLYEHFNSELPSLDERGIYYFEGGFEGEYRGTAEQNKNLHAYLDYLENEGRLGALAFPPSTVEGTSTAGWTDDGSIVRLNTASDSVGIGTTNPTEKLTVQNGNLQVSGNITLSGGTINFGGANGTSTLTSANSGRLGVGTTTPRATFSVVGSTMFSGTTTTGGLNATSAVTSLLNTTSLSVSGSATSSFQGAINLPTGQCFQVNGTCVGASAVQDWQQLISSSTPIATSTMTLSIAAAQDLIIVVDVLGSQSNNLTMLFNLDNGSNYSYSLYTGYNATPVVGKGTAYIPLGVDTSTTTARYFQVRVKNQSSIIKRVFYDGVINSGTPTDYPGTSISAVAFWNNTSAQITSVTLQMGTAGQTFNANTSVTIYGSKN